MRIGVCLLGINREMGGNFQYAISLLEDLVDVVSSQDVVVFVDNQVMEESARAVARSATIIELALEPRNILVTLARFVYSRFRFRWLRPWISGRFTALDQEGCDVILHPFWSFASILTDTPAVASIHDVAPRENPELMPRRKRLSLDWLIQGIIRHAKVILVDSPYGKALLDIHYSAELSKVTVYRFSVPRYLLVGGRSETDDVLSKYQTSAGYLFLPGRFGSYRNTHRVLDAVAEARRNGTDARLLLCGVRPEEMQAAQEAVATRRLEGAVLVLGYVPDADMASLYRGAAALLFPILLGPTSIPIYEAMALDCPVIYPTISGYTTAFGDAGLGVDPLDTSAITDAIIKICNEADLRSVYIRRGREFIAASAVGRGSILLQCIAQASATLTLS